MHIPDAKREIPQKLSLKAKLIWYFGSLLTLFTGETTNKTAPGRAPAGAAVTGRHLVPAEQQHPTFCPWGEKKKKKKDILLFFKILEQLQVTIAGLGGPCNWMTTLVAAMGPARRRHSVQGASHWVQESCGAQVFPGCPLHSPCRAFPALPALI